MRLWTLHFEFKLPLPKKTGIFDLVKFDGRGRDSLQIIICTELFAEMRRDQSGPPPIKSSVLFV